MHYLKKRNARSSMPKRSTPTARFADEQVITDATDEARDLYGKSRYGESIKGGRVSLSLLEAFYLLEEERLAVTDARGKAYDTERFLKRAKRLQPNFWTRYCVFRDLRSRGYIVKTALKFGADFRVYDKGIKPGEDHARWVCFAVHESQAMTWHEFSAKNRVAHSTKKRLLLGVVDEEGDVTYWEIGWLRP